MFELTALEMHQFGQILSGYSKYGAKEESMMPSLSMSWWLCWVSYFIA